MLDGVYAGVPRLHVRYLSDANLIISMYTVYTHILAYTKWFHKCLTPMAGEDPWGQAFVEPLGVYAGVHRMYACMCLYMCVRFQYDHFHVHGSHIYGSTMIISRYMVHVYICSSTQRH